LDWTVHLQLPEYQPQSTPVQ